MPVCLFIFLSFLTFIGLIPLTIFVFIPWVKNAIKFFKERRRINFPKFAFRLATIATIVVGIFFTTKIKLVPCADKTKTISFCNCGK